MTPSATGRWSVATGLTLPHSGRHTPRCSARGGGPRPGLGHAGSASGVSRCRAHDERRDGPGGDVVAHGDNEFDGAEAARQSAPTGRQPTAATRPINSVSERSSAASPHRKPSTTCRVARNASARRPPQPATRHDHPDHTITIPPTPTHPIPTSTPNNPTSTPSTHPTPPTKPSSHRQLPPYSGPGINRLMRLSLQ